MITLALLGSSTLARRYHVFAARPVPISRAIVTLAIVVLLSGGWHVSQTSAQVNIEAQRQSVSDSGFSGTVATSLLLRTGNVELFRVGIRGRVDHHTASTSSFLVGRGDLGLLGSDRFYNAGLVHFRLGWRWRPVLMPEVYAQVNYDEPRLLEFRAVTGGGIRITAADREATGLWIGTGYMFEYERLDLPDTARVPGCCSDPQTGASGA